MLFRLRSFGITAMVIVGLLVQTLAGLGQPGQSDLTLDWSPGRECRVQVVERTPFQKVSNPSDSTFFTLRILSNNSSVVATEVLAHNLVVNLSSDSFGVPMPEVLEIPAGFALKFEIDLRNESLKMTNRKALTTLLHERYGQLADSAKKASNAPESSWEEHRTNFEGMLDFSNFDSFLRYLIPLNQQKVNWEGETTMRVTRVPATFPRKSGWGTIEAEKRTTVFQYDPERPVVRNLYDFENESLKSYLIAGRLEELKSTGASAEELEQMKMGIQEMFREFDLHFSEEEVIRYNPKTRWVEKLQVSVTIAPQGQAELGQVTYITTIDFIE